MRIGLVACCGLALTVVTVCVWASAQEGGHDGMVLVAGADPVQVRNDQACLKRLGYYAGPIDGLWGVQSQAALEAWASQAFRGSLEKVSPHATITHFRGVCSRVPSQPSTPTGALQADTISPQDMDRLTTYTVLMGRATACGVDMDAGASAVGAWVDRTFTPGSPRWKVAMVVLMEGTRHHAQQQASGRSPDTCAAVSRAWKGMRWP